MISSPYPHRRPHFITLDQLRLVSPQCILDRLQHKSQLSAVSVGLYEINHPAQDRPLIGIEIAGGSLLDADERIARQQAVSNLRQLGPPLEAGVPVAPPPGSGDRPEV